MDPTTTALQQGLPRPGWLPETIPLWAYRLVMAVVFLTVAYYLSQFARRLLARRIARRFERPSVGQTVLRSIQAGIVVVAVMTALGFFGIGLGNVVLSVGVFSAVAGIILAPIIGNLINGVFILSEQPYEIGDMIELEDTDTKGFVEDITLFYTKVFTLDNTFIVLPNGSMRERDVINYSAEDARVRLTVDVGVTYESDIETAREQLRAAARDVDGVIKGGPDIRIGSARYPAVPVVHILEFGDSEVALRLRFWVREPYTQATVRSAVLTNVWERFDDHDIEIPYPHSHLVFDDTSGELQTAIRRRGQQAAARQGGATTRDEDQEAPASEPGTETQPADDADGSR